MCTVIKMVDLISTRTIDLTKLAMDGLMERQKAISSNTANVMTPGYVRKDVSFENQLQNIISDDDTKEQMKLQNSLQYNPTSVDLAMGNIGDSIPNNYQLSQSDKDFLQSDEYSGFSPEVSDDTTSAADQTGNNVNMESEIMDMAKTGTQYNVLATLETKAMQNIASAIKGGT